MTVSTADVTEGTANPFDQILEDQKAPPAAPGSAQPSGDDAEDDDAEDDGDASAEEDGAAELGDKGKQALVRMKDRLREERAKRRAAEQRLAQQSDADDTARIHREAEQAALAKANDRIVRAEVRAAAAGRLADPADAMNFIDLDQFEVDDDGSVDQDDIAQAITDLLTRKPYLAAQGGNRGPRPDRSQGAGDGKGTATAEQLFAAAITQAGF